MQFQHPPLEQAIGAQTGVNAPWRDNFRLESRIDEPRRIGFEAAMPASLPATELEKAHNDYVANHVNLANRRRLPKPFQPGNDLARLASPDPAEILVRVEDLSWVLPDFPGNAEQMVASFKAGEPVFKRFFKTYDRKRGPWPMFAALTGDLEITHPHWEKEWWNVLPQILGLGHLDASPAAPRPLALMRYTVKRVLDGCSRAPGNIFTAPTVIDQKLNKFFMPSPFPQPGSGVSYGHAVNLAASGTLACELIHRHVSYELSDVKDMTVLDGPVANGDISVCRRAHLAALRRQPGCDQFGMDCLP